MTERRPSTRRQSEAAPPLDLRRAVLSGIDRTFINEAKVFGEHMKKRELTTSQIRNIFGRVKKMQQEGFDLANFLMLKPYLAYAAGRPGGASVRPLKEVLTPAIDAVAESGSDPDEQERRFKRFCQGFEAILAYHRAAGGK